MAVCSGFAMEAYLLWHIWSESVSGIAYERTTISNSLQIIGQNIWGLELGTLY